MDIVGTNELWETVSKIKQGCFLSSIFNFLFFLNNKEFNTLVTKTMYFTEHLKKIQMCV